MKKITLLLFSFIVSLNCAKAQTILFDFDTVNANHVFLDSWNGTWPNTAFAKVANPNISGINTSANVGKFISNGGVDAQLATENPGTGVSTIVPQFDFNAMPYFVMKVWVNKPVKVTVEFKNNGYYPEFVKKTVNVTTVNQWVNVEFNCSDIAFGAPGNYWGTYDRFGIYFDADLTGGTVANDAYYFDDIRLSATTTLSTKDFTADNAAVFYPNPASEYINVKNTEKVVIMDLNGRKVKEAVNVEKVDISTLAKGAYIVKIGTGNSAKSSKLIKE